MCTQFNIFLALPPSVPPPRNYDILRWLHTLFIIGGLVPNLEFSRENVKNICKNKYNFFSLKSETQVMFILMF
jgi:hypothetical protein